MMIRLFSLSLLLGLACTVQAATLYRWVEADGSITFSPVKPAAGIDYEVVGGIEPAASKPSETDQADEQTSAPSSADRQSIEASVQWMNTSRQGQSTSLNSEPPFAAARPLPSMSNPPVRSATPMRAESQAMASRNKRSRQCQELNMRVTSLEERMRARLTPEAMDRTVMSMARYRKSLERFCS